MSPLQRTRAILRSTLPSTQRLTLIALMDYADALDEAWPSVRTLQADTGFGDKAVRRALLGLVEAGVLTVVGERNQCRVFRLVEGAIPARGPVARTDTSGRKDRPSRSLVPVRSQGPGGPVPKTVRSGRKDRRSNQEATKEAANTPVVPEGDDLGLDAEVKLTAADKRWTRFVDLYKSWPGAGSITRKDFGKRVEAAHKARGEQFWTVWEWCCTSNHPELQWHRENRRGRTMVTGILGVRGKSWQTLLGKWENREAGKPQQRQPEPNEEPEVRKRPTLWGDVTAGRAENFRGRLMWLDEIADALVAEGKTPPPHLRLVEGA
jgi:hypothetical protein